MKLILALFTIFLMSQHLVYSQHGNDSNEKLYQCLNDLEQRLYSEELEASAIVENILTHLGISRNFFLLRCDDINNAYAWYDVTKQVSYIIYDLNFLQRLKDYSSNWADALVFAHEVGHHLCGHTIHMPRDLEHRRTRELEADKFAGHSMYLLGASLEEILSVMPQICDDSDDTESTHPMLSKRQQAIEEGYMTAKNLRDVLTDNEAKTFESYFLAAKQAYIHFDYENALLFADTAISMNPSFVESYFQRARINAKLNMLEAAVDDLNLVIENSMNHTYALAHRGMILYKLQYREQACMDLMKACTLGHALSCKNHSLFCGE